MTSVNDLTVYVDREYRLDLAGNLCLKVFHNCGPGLWSHLKAQLEKDTPVNSRGCWQESAPHGVLNKEPHFPMACWPEASLSSLPHVPLQRTAHNCKLWPSLRAGQWEQEWARQKPQSFWNLTLEGTSLCHILFVRSKSLGPAHREGEGITQGHAHQDVGVIGVILEAAYHPCMHNEE